MTDKLKKPRGLAALKISDPERFQEIVTNGGRANKNKFTKDNAREMALRSAEARRSKS